MSARNRKLASINDPKTAEEVELFDLISRAGLHHTIEAMRVHSRTGVAGAVGFLRGRGILTSEESDKTPGAIASARVELGRQFETCFSLVAAALDQLEALCAHDDNKKGELGVPLRLLELAFEELGDLQYLRRIA